MVSNSLRRIALSTLNLRARLKKAPPVIDPFSPAFQRDPYPFYRELRERDPVHFHPLGAWIITRHADALTVWTDPRFGHPPLHYAKSDPAQWIRSQMFITRNPPDHTQVREVLGSLFSQRKLDALKPRMQGLAQELLDRVEPGGRMDVVKDFATPFPVGIMAQLLGLPAEDLPHLRKCSQSVMPLMDAFPMPEFRDQGNEAGRAFISYFSKLIEARRAHPGDDWISCLISAQEDAGSTDDELMANCILMFIAGHETTVGLISSGILTLLRNPDALASLREQPERMPKAVEECLRFDPPVQLIGRMAMKDVRIDGKLIRKGQTVYIAIGAINRDPEITPDPDRFDISRSPGRHLAFGSGIHHCIGQYLARMEGAVALDALIRRFPKLRLDGDPVYTKRSTSGRGLVALPLRFD